MGGTGPLHPDQLKSQTKIHLSSSGESPGIRCGVPGHSVVKTKVLHRSWSFRCPCRSSTVPVTPLRLPEESPTTFKTLLTVTNALQHLHDFRRPVGKVYPRTRHTFKIESLPVGRPRDSRTVRALVRRPPTVKKDKT